MTHKNTQSVRERFKKEFLDARKLNQFWAKDLTVDWPKVADWWLDKLFVPNRKDKEDILEKANPRARMIDSQFWIKEDDVRNLLSTQAAAILAELEGLPVYYRSLFSKDSSRGENEKEQNTEVVEREAMFAIVKKHLLL